MPPAPRNAPSPTPTPTPSDGGDAVLIAGAGIGGLTAALALARRGLPVRLLEAAATPRTAGAGIQLSPNATRILLGLGLGPALQPCAVTPTVIRMRAARGGVLAALPLDGGAGDAPYWVIHRADLHRVLFDAVTATPGVTVSLGARVRDFERSAGGAVRVHTVHDSVVNDADDPGDTDPRDDRLPKDTHPKDNHSKDSHHDGAVLIGADGLWSRLRTLTCGSAAPPRFSGRCAFRAVVPAAQVAPEFAGGAVDVWLGPGGHVVHYPVHGGAAVNIVAVCSDRWQSREWSTAAAPAAVLERFAAPAWAPAVRDLLAAPQHWHRWALYDRAPLPSSWGRGPVTLLGDAAHPMLPYLAQGAAMAIEDAAVLAAELARGGDPALALRRYEAARAPRTARVQGAARGNDFRYHVRGPLALVRDAVLRTLPPQRLVAQYDWIYRWHA